MQVRFARHTDRLDEVVRFYRDGLGLREIGRFADHDGYDGVFLGRSTATPPRQMGADSQTVPAVENRPNPGHSRPEQIRCPTTQCRFAVTAIN